MFIMFVREQSHLFDDQVSNFFFIGQELFFAYLQMVVFSLRIDKGLRQCRNRFPENFIKGIPVIGIDPALKMKSARNKSLMRFLILIAAAPFGLGIQNVFSFNFFTRPAVASPIATEGTWRAWTSFTVVKLSLTQVHS